MLWVWIGTCPRNSSTSAFSLWRRGRGEKRKRARVEGDGKEATEAQRSEDAEAGGPGREQSSRAEAPPTRPRVNPSGRGGAVGASAHFLPPCPFHFAEAFFPSHPSFTAGAPSTTGGKRSCCSTSSSLARAKFSAGVGASQAGPEAPAGWRDRPSPQTLLLSPTFSEQLRLAALQGTDLPGQSLLQHL